MSSRCFPMAHRWNAGWCPGKTFSRMPDRMRRVNEAVREVVSVRIAEGLRDPRIGFVTVTSVDTSPDLRQARVYVSVLGTPEERVATMAGLESAHGVLQMAVAQELRLTHTPTLHFVFDESIDRGMRLSVLLDDDAWASPPNRNGSWPSSAPRTSCFSRPTRSRMATRSARCSRWT